MRKVLENVVVLFSFCKKLRIHSSVPHATVEQSIILKDTHFTHRTQPNLLPITATVNYRICNIMHKTCRMQHPWPLTLPSPPHGHVWLGLHEKSSLHSTELGALSVKPVELNLGVSGTLCTSPREVASLQCPSEL